MGLKIPIRKNQMIHGVEESSDLAKQVKAASLSIKTSLIGAYQPFQSKTFHFLCHQNS
jgi:hypothetical protein